MDKKLLTPGPLTTSESTKVRAFNPENENGAGSG